MKRYFILSVYFLIFPLTHSLFAQNFELVEQKEYEEYYKKPIYTPDVRFHGKYQYYTLSYQDASSNTNNAWQNFELKMQSEVQENVHLFLNFTNSPYDWGATSNNGYTIYDTNLRQRSNQNLNLQIREFYLEYNSNPHAIFRVGRQKINLGDKLGLIYKGVVDAVTITCRIGTWCYEFGQANFDTNASRATWLQFFYPVYESIAKVQNYWLSKKARKQEYLNVDFYRIDDKQNNLALANYGGRTYAPQNSTYSEEHMRDNNNKYIFYDREYLTYGVNVSWIKNNIALYFHGIQSIGKRDYYNLDNQPIADAKNNTVGKLYRLEWQQLLSENSQFGVTILASSGSRDKKDVVANYPWLSDNDYYEWNRGSYQGAAIYFGGNYRGQQHSLNNLMIANLYYKFHGYKYNIDVVTEIFQFTRNANVLAKNGNLVKNIGTEINLNITKKLAENFLLEIDTGYFLPAAAYATKESIMPTGTSIDNITQYSVGLNYQF